MRLPLRFEMPVQIAQDDAQPITIPGKAPAPPPAPTWHMLFPVGKTKHREDFPEGLDFDTAKLGSFVRNFERAKSRYLGKDGFGLPVTFGHVGGGSTSNLRPPEHRRAAGWIEGLSLRPDGLYGLIKWTREAREQIRADQWRFVSPEFMLSFMDPDTGAPQGPTFFGAALVNDPFLYELPRVAASRTPQGATMDKAKLCNMLGLSVEASDEDVEKALAERLAANKASKEELTRLSASIELSKSATTDALASKADAEKKLVELSAANQAAEAKLKTLELAVKTEAAKAFCADMVRQGRMLPARVEATVAFAMRHGLDELKELLKDAPPVVDLKVHGVSGDGAGAGAGDKTEARRTFFAAVDELVAKEKVSPEVATKRVRLAQPELAKLVFSVTP